MSEKNICDRCEKTRSFFKVLIKPDEDGKYFSEKVCYECINKYNPPRHWRQYSNPSNPEKV